jgi:hypothetical protein
MQNKEIRCIVNSCYDIQKLRIQAGNRIVANFRSKIEIDPSKKPTDAETKKILNLLKKEYRSITESAVKITRRFKPGNIITDYAELLLMHQFDTLLNAEKKMFRDLEKSIHGIDIWEDYLKGVKGVGPAMAGIIIAYIDIYKAKYVSSLWRFSGLDVAEDLKGRSRRKEHLREYEYTNKDGEVKTKLGITFNPILKTKLIGVLGPSFIKQQGDYAEIYYNYKNRLINRDDLKEAKPIHIHNMAIRYMVKQFLADLFIEWKNIKGLPVPLPYHEAKLGLKHKAA